MPVATSEANLESIIEQILVYRRSYGQTQTAEPPPSYAAGPYQPGGYIKRKPADYDRALCLDPGMAVKFVQATQPQEWQKFEQQHGPDTAQRFTSLLAQRVNRKGTLDVLRNGFKHSGSRFRLAFFRPNTSLNPEEQRRYQGNLFSVIRQLRYRPKEDRSQPELDLVLFLNGLPLFTIELKNEFTSQTIEEAMRQYRRDRDPREPLFKLGRCLAHFAVDSRLVAFTTQLEGAKTRFFPFNRGFNNGAGNPPVSPLDGRFANSYLWETIWSRDSVLNLVERFVQFEDVEGGKKGQQRLIFPRYHQLDAVRHLIDDARLNGPGSRYLIQHSAGSGKTKTIAWLAHQLAVLHDDQDQPIFDSVIVITDRRVLDRQLQTQMRQFEQVRGVVENIDQTSRQLKEALESGKHIIVTTLQKFPVISREIAELPGSRFAVIIDEAHSSQSGASTQEINRALQARSLEEAEEAEAGVPEDMEDVIALEMELRRALPNVSSFAFTATPKPKTLQLFGTRNERGQREPFSLYPMRQAIEEGFIRDVLQNYTTYHAYWQLLKTIDEDPRYERKKASHLLRSFVELHDQAINQKVAIIVEHFTANVAGRLDGRTKTMIVTRSRPARRAHQARP